MDLFEIALLSSLIILFVLMIAYYSKCKQKIVKLLFGICSGIVLLFPVQLILASLGVNISINILTLSVSGILGIPGVILITAISIL